MNPVILLDDVSVRYHAPEELIGSFKEYAIQVLNQGEILGIIGRNGAGKSTLLKVISRVLIPTEGRVRLRGAVSPLLELGAGFHPELTGRENIFLNATLLGRSQREIESRLPEIIEFADLGAFIDSPLRTYSSGMIARLGFSVSTTWKPDILILDEVLSVGDEAFRHKCEQRMEKYRDEGTTTLLVTHDSSTVESLCARALWLDHGQVRAVGPAKEIVDLYHESQL
jgi:ABC-type polysaccharide/polyol phosphate transport system ATPase subunit